MRVLFVASGEPIAPDYSGASSRLHQNLAALRRLADALYVVRMLITPQTAAVQAFEQQSEAMRALRQQANGWEDVPLPTPKPGSRWSRYWQSLVDPAASAFGVTPQARAALEARIAQIQPDLIWVERPSVAALLPASLKIPWVLSLHDVPHNVLRIRYQKPTPAQRWKVLTSRRAEMAVYRRTPALVTASANDAERTRQLGARRTELIDMAYDAIRPEPDGHADAQVKIVHLGSLETTANRLGVEAYLRKVQPLVGERARLCIVGDASRLKEPLESLLRDAHADLRGFVPDLAAALCPYDIAILPYEYESGYRTKLPVLFNYAQAVVTTRTAVAGMWHDSLAGVCVVERLEDFPAAILRLIDDPPERERLGKAAYAYYRAHYTLDAVQDSYRALLESLVAP